MSAAVTSLTDRLITAEDRYSLELIQRAEERLQGVSATLRAAVEPIEVRPTFADAVAGRFGGLYATSYCANILLLARHTLTDHDAGTLRPHILGMAEALARHILDETAGDAA